MVLKHQNRPTVPTKGEKYVLFIEKGIASATDKALNTPVKFEFTIE